MTRRSLAEIFRGIGYRNQDRPLKGRWGMLPNRVHLGRGDRRKGHILRIRHHRGQPES